MSFITAYSANDAYVEMMSLLKKGSIESSPRGMKVKERLGVSVRIFNPRARIITETNRNFPLKGALAEFLWYMSENNKIKYILPYLKHWINYSDDGETVHSNYGYQWKHQLSDVIQKIKKDKYTRQGVVTLYDSKYASYYGKDNVCTPDFQFLLRDDLLYLIVNARSRDVIRGECIDQFTFTLLQETVANELGVDLGWYQVNIGSLHIYEEHFHLLEKPFELDTSSFEISPNKTYLKYSDFWNVLHKNKHSELIENDFIRFWTKEKNIDLTDFYIAYTESNKSQILLTT